MTPGSPMPVETRIPDCLLLPRVQTSWPQASSSMSALPVYHATIDEIINSQPVSVISQARPVSSPIAAVVDPAARNVNKMARALLSADAAPTATQVIAASTMNQKPISGNAPTGGGILPTANITFNIPYAIQNDPHIPCTAVAPRHVP